MPNHKNKDVIKIEREAGYIQKIIFRIFIAGIIIGVIACYAVIAQFNKQDEDETDTSSSDISVSSQSSFYIPGGNNYTIIQQQTAKVNYQDSNTVVYIVTDDPDYNKDGYPLHQAYILVDSDQGILIDALAEYSLDDTLYTADVDGDRVDEFIIQQNVDLMGGFGQYASYVYKLETGQLNRIFEYTCFEPSGYDMGFSANVVGDNSLEITNRFTEYSFQTLISESDAKDPNGIFWCDSFCFFEPEDIDHDGIYELSCEQYAAWPYHSSCIGFCQSYLKYDSASQQFYVTKTEFRPSQHVFDYENPDKIFLEP